MQREMQTSQTPLRLNSPSSGKVSVRWPSLWGPSLGGRLMEAWGEAPTARLLPAQTEQMGVHTTALLGAC